MPSKLRTFGAHNCHELPQWRALDDATRFEMQVVGSVLPFRTNSYVVDELIDWGRVPDDPLYRLTFPQRGMLRDEHYEQMARLHRDQAPPAELRREAARIRAQLNPNPAGQKQHNVPTLDGQRLPGVQHKYRETALVFPREGQTCHAYCTYCFRWAQFVGEPDLRFALREPRLIAEYLRRHTEISDALITGGDPMIMKARQLARYVDAILEADPPALSTLRFGTKALAYWPYRFTDDEDAPALLELFRRVLATGRHVAIMAHFNHRRELETAAAREAIARLRELGCEIRTQAPCVRHVNDSVEIWTEMVREQVRLGLIPYYLFVVRDTGAQHYFGVPLARALRIYRGALQRLSGLGRTLRGPSMSATPGKIEVLDVLDLAGEKVFALRFLQAREPSWVGRVFHARFDAEAIWLDDLRPAFSRPRFFFEEELSLPGGMAHPSVPRSLLLPDERS